METLLETHVNRGAANEAIGCAASVPLILLVVVLVNLVIGEDQLPREVRGITPYLVAATALSGLFAGWLWKRSRIRLTVVEREGVRYVEIYDPTELLVLQGPFEVRYGYARLHVPKAGTQTFVVVGLYKDGELELSLTETWGSAYAPPEGWPGDFALEGPAKASYTSAGQSYCQELVALLT